MRVPGHEWLYVVGDANGRVLLTHMGKYQARLAADHILGRDVSLRSDGPLSPRVIFTEPQVAAVGHTLASARAAGLSVRAVDQSIDAVAGASFVGHGAPGMARIVIDEERQRARRRDVRRRRRRRVAARGDDRRRRRGAAASG